MNDIDNCLGKFQCLHPLFQDRSVDSGAEEGLDNAAAWDNKPEQYQGGQIFLQRTPCKYYQDMQDCL